MAGSAAKKEEDPMAYVVNRRTLNEDQGGKLSLSAYDALGRIPRSNGLAKVFALSAILCTATVCVSYTRRGLADGPSKTAESTDNLRDALVAQRLDYARNLRLTEAP